VKDKGGGWTGPAFTFTAEAEKEIRRAFGGKFPEAAISSFLRSVASALTKVATDRKELKADPRAARDRAEKVAALLAKAAHQIAKMTETERDVFDLAVSGDPVALPDLVDALDRAAMGFARAADGHALQRGEKVAGPDAVAMFVAAQAAVAWRAAFGIEPVEHDGADFVTVLDAIIDAAGLPRLGTDAIRSAIKGPPKNRK
jgi:hypothetical protein